MDCRAWNSYVTCPHAKRSPLRSFPGAGLCRELSMYSHLHENLRCRRTAVLYVLPWCFLSLRLVQNRVGNAARISHLDGIPILDEACPYLPMRWAISSDTASPIFQNGFMVANEQNPRRLYAGRYCRECGAFPVDLRYDDAGGVCCVLGNVHAHAPDSCSRDCPEGWSGSTPRPPERLGV